MAINFPANKPYGFGTGVPAETKAGQRPSGNAPEPQPTQKKKGSGGAESQLGGALNLVRNFYPGEIAKAEQGFKFANNLGNGSLKDKAAVAEGVNVLKGLDPQGLGKYAGIAEKGLSFADNVKSGSLKGTDAAISGLNLASQLDPGLGQYANIAGQGIDFAKNVKNGSLKGTDAAISGLSLAGQLDPSLGKYATFADQGLSFAKDLNSGKLQGTDAAASGLNFAANVIGGEVGQKLALGGDIATNISNISTNTVPGAAGGNFVGLGLDMAQLLGVKIDPGVSSLAGLGASLLAGPAGWLGAGVQLLSSIFSMGDHNKNVDLQSGVNVTGNIPDEDDEEPTDKSSIFDHTNTGFLSIGSSHSSSVQYDTTGATIDPRLLKDVEFKIEDRPNTHSGLFGMMNDNAGKKQITIKANYDGINPSTGGTSGETKIDLSPEDVERYKSALGGESGKINPAETAKLAVVKPQIDSMQLSFKQNENDPTLHTYSDVNKDGIPDLISVSMNMQGLEKKGDGSVSVTIMDKNRKPVGDTLTAKGSDKIEENLKEAGVMQQLRPLLDVYSASHPETWDGGKDLNSAYQALKANGGLEKLKQIGPAYAEYAQARQTPGADPAESLTKANGLAKEMGLTFNAQAYAAANPDLAKSIGTDPSRLAQHYRDHGNAEGRPVNTASDKAPQWINPALRNTTVLGSEISASANKSAEITKGQSLLSSNGKFMATLQSDGNFVVYDISGKDKKLMWDAKTNEQHHSGFLGFGGSTSAAADRIAIQSDGNLAAHGSSNNTPWASNSANTSVNRGFKLTMQDDGSLAIKDSQGGADLWSSGGGLKQKAANTDGTAPVFAAANKAPVTYGSESLKAV